jgi:sirohydrochlorin ferrochelatase
MSFVLTLALAPAFAAAPPGVGVLLLAHGGDPSWNATVQSVADGVHAPTEVAFGMADGDAMQAAVDKLQQRGAKKIVAVPLFVSSHSSLYRQTQYLLGARPKPSEDFLSAMDAMNKAMAAGGGHAGHPMGSPAAIHHKVKTGLPISVAPALDTDPIIADILTNRAQKLSKDPAKEALVLVAHGPIEESDDKAWLADLGRLAKQIKKRLSFRDAAAFTLRDDAPPKVRSAAVDKLRSAVKDYAKKGDVVVVPVLVSGGGIEQKLKKDLEGLDFKWSGETLAPDPRLSALVEKRAEEASNKELK